MAGAATSTTRSTGSAATSEPCEESGSVDPVAAGFPDARSGATGTEIRVGSHGGFERVVVEFVGGAVVDERRPFIITVLDAPARLVTDIAAP